MRIDFMRIRGFAIGLIVVLAMGGCSKSSTASNGGATIEPATPAPGRTPATITLGGQTANYDGTGNVSGEKSIKVVMSDSNGYFFKPTVIKGDASQTISIELVNNSTTLHNFSVQAFNQSIDQDVKPGETKTVKVQFGNVLDSIAVFHCKYHATLGMRGALEVPR